MERLLRRLVTPGEDRTHSGGIWCFRIADVKVRALASDEDLV